MEIPVENTAYKKVGVYRTESVKGTDFYPTPPEVTIALLDYFKFKPNCRILEPACGDGAMSKVLESYNQRVTSSDLRISGYGSSGVDFLKSYDGERFNAVITNPPFSVAEEFIKKSLTLAPFVAMVLKSQYWHAKRRQDLFKEFPPAYVMPLSWRPDFLGSGSSLMDVIWTVWVKGDTLTKYVPLAKPQITA